VDVARVSEAELAEKMVGRAVTFRIEKKPAKPGDMVLKIDPYPANVEKMVSS
jgi:simple sugar transport system ATP-binding protein